MNRNAELVSRIRERASEAFAAFYERWKKRLFRTILAMTDDQGAAEEILRAVFFYAAPGPLYSYQKRRSTVDGH